MSRNCLWNKIEGLARKVSECMPQGSTEKQYQSAMAAALASLGLSFRSQEPIAVSLPRGAIVGERVPDFVVGRGEDTIVIELKTSIWFSPEHRSQLQGYLELLSMSRGMLLGFSTQQKGRYNIELVTPTSSLESSWGDNGDLAAEKQLNFLKTLYQRRFGSFAGCPQNGLTKAHASKIIDLLRSGSDEELREYIDAFHADEELRHPHVAPAEPITLPALPTPPAPSTPTVIPVLPTPPTPSTPPILAPPSAHRPLWNTAAPDIPPSLPVTSPDPYIPPPSLPIEKAEQGRAGQSPSIASPSISPASSTPDRRSLYFYISLPLYKWLIDLQINQEASSVGAVAIPLIKGLLQREVMLPFQGFDALKALPARGKGKRISIHCSEPAFWGAFKRGHQLAGSHVANEHEWARLLLGMAHLQASSSPPSPSR